MCTQDLPSAAKLAGDAGGVRLRLEVCKPSRLLCYQPTLLLQNAYQRFQASHDCVSQFASAKHSNIFRSFLKA
jgi:hypothetical protein